MYRVKLIYIPEAESKAKQGETPRRRYPDLGALRYRRLNWGLPVPHLAFELVKATCIMAEAKANRSTSEDPIYSISISTVKEDFGNFIILRLVN